MPGKVQGAVAAQTPPPGAEGNGNGQVPGAPEPTTGVTNVPAAAGPMSPSNVGTMSPEAAMQRFMAARGGAANAPA